MDVKRLYEFSNIDILRQKYRLSLSDLARLSKVTEGTLRRWKHEGKMSVSNLQKIKAAFEARGETFSEDIFSCRTFKELRESLVLSQNAFAEIIGMSRSSYSRIEIRDGDITTQTDATKDKVQEGLSHHLKKDIILYPPQNGNGQFSLTPPDYSTVNIKSIHSFKKLRECIGNISQEELAKKLGVSASTIVKAELGRSKLAERTLWKIEELVLSIFDKKVKAHNSMVRPGEFSIELIKEQVKRVISPYEEFVYFMQEYRNGNIKIGYTNDLSKRIKPFKTATSTRPQRIIATLPGGRELESELHKRFSRFQLKDLGRDWFSPDEEVLKYIQDNLKFE